MTSSVAATYGSAIDAKAKPNYTFGPEDWNTTSSLTDNAYHLSKTLAEKEARDLCKEQDRWTMATINPSGIYGPSLW